jgi:glycosyltransferase involved in cell wall biosynthesis
MEVLFVTESLSPSKNTGVASTAASLARSLSPWANVELIAPVELDDPDETEIFLQGLHVHLFPQPRGLPRTVVPALKQFLAKELPRFDLVHIHGMWRYPQWAAAHLAQQLRIPYIISPHGMCEPFELARKAWKKKIYFNLIEKRSFQEAAAIHAITEAERDQCNQLQHGKKIEVIPHGIDIAPPLPSSLVNRYLPPEMSSVPTEAPVLFFMGRLHPKKGLDLLIPAFAQILQHHPSTYLVIAGPDPVGYKKTLIQLARSHYVQERVLFPGMLTGQCKQAMLQRADIFTLPSYSEGFSVAILEALAAAKPVVISKHCYFDEVRSAQCGHVIDTDIPQLVLALNKFLDLDAVTRSATGLRGQRFIKQGFTWSTTAERMIQLYQSAVIPRSKIQVPA